MPGIVPRAPAPKQWSMTYLPNAPLALARPSGQSWLFELRRIRVDSSAEAQRNTKRARYSVGCIVTASMTRTPLARPVAASYRTLSTTLLGLSVIRPVFRAAGRVDPKLLK